MNASIASATVERGHDVDRVEGAHPRAAQVAGGAQGGAVGHDEVELGEHGVEAREETCLLVGPPSDPLAMHGARDFRHREL
jgi:hypothetical protein